MLNKIAKRLFIIINCWSPSIRKETVLQLSDFLGSAVFLPNVARLYYQDDSFCVSVTVTAVPRLFQIHSMTTLPSGESVCRLLEFLGHDVLRLNHVGDWGTQA